MTCLKIWQTVKFGILGKQVQPETSLDFIATFQ